METRCVNGSAWTYHADPTLYEPGRPWGVLVLVVGGFVALVLPVWIWSRRHYQPLKSRSLPLVFVMTSLALLVTTVKTGLELALTVLDMPCDVGFISGMLFPLLAGPPALIRLVRLHALYRLNRRKQKLRVTNKKALSELSSLRKQASDVYLAVVLVLAIAPSSIAMLVLYEVDTVLGTGCVNCPLSYGDMVVNFVQGLTYMVVFSVLIYKTRHMHDAFYVRRELLHWTFLWVLVMASMMVLYSVPSLHTEAVRGTFDPGFMFLVGTLGAAIICGVLPTLATYGIGPYAVISRGVALRTAALASSGWNHSKRMSVTSTTNPLSQLAGGRRSRGPSGVRTNSRTKSSSIEEERASVELGTFSPGEITGNGEADDFDTGEETVVIGAGDNREAELGLLLSHPRGAEAFTAHLTSEFSVENIRFYFAVDAYRGVAASGPVAAAKEAVHMYEHYVHQLAPLMVNLPAGTVRKIEQVLRVGKFAPKSGGEAVAGAEHRDGEGDVDGDSDIDGDGEVGSGATASTFDEAQQEVFKLMAFDSYPRFCGSVFFRAYTAGHGASAGAVVSDGQEPVDDGQSGSTRSSLSRCASGFVAWFCGPTEDEAIRRKDTFAAGMAGAGLPVKRGATP